MIKKQYAFLFLLLLAVTFGMTAFGGSALDLNTLTRAEVYESETTSLSQLSYRLYIPEDYNKANTYSMLVYFHDSSASGSDNEAPLADADRTALISTIVSNATYAKDVFVLVPQCPEGQTWVKETVADGTYTYNENMESPLSEIFMDLLDNHLLKEYNIDREHICLAGLYEGGTMVCDLSTRYPDRFLSGLNVGGVVDTARAADYDKENLRMFGKTGDTTYSSTVGLTILSSMLSTDSKTAVTVFEDGEDPVWKSVYGNEDNLKWMFSFTASEEASVDVPENGTLAGSENLTEEETDAQTEAPIDVQAGQSFFERNHISQRTLVLILLGVTVLVGFVALIVGYRETKVR